MIREAVGEAGVNPELEMLRFLGERGFRAIPRLLGWFEYEGHPADATLGIVQEFIADGRDGWGWTRRNSSAVSVT